MQFVILIIILAVCYALFVTHWQIIVGIAVSALITGIICEKMKKGKSEKEKIQVENDVVGGYLLLLAIFFVGSCMFGGDKDKKDEIAQDMPKTEQVEQQKPVEKPPEKTPEQIQAEIHEQKIRNAKNWCSKVKSTLDSEETKWYSFMNSDNPAEMKVAYDFMRDYGSSLPDIPNDLPEEIQSDMREAKRLIELVFKSRMAVIDSLNFMSRDRENWYKYNEDIAEQTKIVYQDTKQEVNQIYSLLESIRNRLE